ncbi:hypothetical protein CGH81_16135 [Vibrio parahaemolyticus]|uniref:Solitary outer membrane autotransporter beta-barrel domain n=1 Tax=Vibrio parahaemolyticus TaxID=670 RepID=UPI0011203125|nr:Solitary outer membrane autotransporter beta-barrel domain [Vibrio parahaemolyticus]EJM7155086.1 Solitary outer membrane autotransporter beta-barrel domain [Vibrio parahaemolyticus]TOM26060.1 hypothetical protein CGH81_16135 [Vibrio parahaemolyticus]HCG7064468.1 Solitary outer membrane autotransporter beta-barrel domain [Vibrio parahaemolyticus]HCH2794646.1 Solitary outer membrane autotransporter beta-barrel domain [Vibrio parahaemolyticus]
MKQAVINSYAIATLSLLSTASQAETLNDLIVKEFEYNFALSVVLTDTDVFTFGFHDFNPNQYFNLSNEDIGTADSLDLRKEIKEFTLPYSFDLAENETEKLTYRFNGRFYLLGIDQDVYFNEEPIPDRSKEQFIGGYNEFEVEKQLTEHFSLSGALGAHLIHYKTDYTYRSDAITALQPILDGALINTSAWALLGQLNAKLKYLEQESWGKWYLWTSPHYFYGTGWGEANNGNVGKPEGWYWVNGVKVFYDVAHIGTTVQSFYTSFSRIDIGGDTSDPLNTTNYYEGSIGWLMTPPFESDWIDNIGIGLTINYGSDLKGGSLVLFFNQD